MLYLLSVLFSFFLAACWGEIPPTENYPHHAQLDNSGKVKLYWDANTTHITFELHGNTNGWVGMGISPNGGMAGADIVMGWVQDGSFVIEDRHGTGKEVPPIDPEQNVEPLEGIEENGWTLIKFRRQIPSCEPGFDLPITADTLKIIYAYGDVDPVNNEISFDNYHETNRGVKSLILLEVTGTDKENFPEGEMHSSFSVQNHEFLIPPEKTYYNCRLLKLPEFSQKQHVVKVDPIIQPGNELMVHHMTLYYCTDLVDESEHVGTDTRCYGSNMPPDFLNCVDVLQAWALGGGSIYYPNHAGYPLGEIDSPKYVVLETHYDNPRELEGVCDSSGLRFVYTDQLRQYDAGIITTGVIVSGTTHLIPPNQESFNNYGECSRSCLEKSMEQGQVEDLKVFGVMLHSHLLGVALKLRLIRNGVELPYLSKDDSYDFNYQETRMLPEERVIKPGDTLQTVCNYKSKGLRSNLTVGGLDTEKEMCEVFVHYYPKIPMNICMTGLGAKQTMKYFGIEEYKFAEGADRFNLYTDIYNVLIVQPEEQANQTVGGYIDSMTWDEEAGKKWEEYSRTQIRTQYCIEGGANIPGAAWTSFAPVIDVPYVEEEPVCLNENMTTTPSDATKTTLASDLTTTGVASRASVCSWLYVTVYIFLRFVVQSAM